MNGQTGKRIGASGFRVGRYASVSLPVPILRSCMTATSTARFLEWNPPGPSRTSISRSVRSSRLPRIPCFTGRVK